jgi:two-component system, cell cycle sensor histidine kinase and response regulator CckA
LSERLLDREVVVLLVGEDPLVRATIEKLLRQGGYDLMIAVDGQDALQKADEHKGLIDLLVSDIQMPGITGPDLATELRRTRPDLRVMFMSAYPQGLLVLDTGWHFIKKPFLAKVLLERIVQIIKKPPAATTERSEE